MGDFLMTMVTLPLRTCPPPPRVGLHDVQDVILAQQQLLHHQLGHELQLRLQ